MPSLSLALQKESGRLAWIGHLALSSAGNHLLHSGQLSLALPPSCFSSLLTSSTTTFSTPSSTASAEMPSGGSAELSVLAFFQYGLSHLTGELPLQEFVIMLSFLTCLWDPLIVSADKTENFIDKHSWWMSYSLIFSFMRDTVSLSVCIMSVLTTFHIPNGINR